MKIVVLMYLSKYCAAESFNYTPDLTIQHPQQSYCRAPHSRLTPTRHHPRPQRSLRTQHNNVSEPISDGSQSHESKALYDNIPYIIEIRAGASDNLGRNTTCAQSEHDQRHWRINSKHLIRTCIQYIKGFS